MLVISSGMQKSGTAYFYNVLNDLLTESGANDARKIKEEFMLDNLLKDANNNIDGISMKGLLRLSFISFKRGTFAVKTHYVNKRIFRILSNISIFKIIYSYRDPRDVILSVIDHGKKLSEAGAKGNFTKMTDLDEALRNVKIWIKDWENLSKRDDIFMYKYEDLINDPLKLFYSVFDFLGIKIGKENIMNILLKYSPDNPDMPRGRLHFNKGIINRYKSEMSLSDQQKIKDTIGKEIYEMGYQI